MPSNGSLCLAKTLTRDLRNGHLESSLTGYYARSFGCKKAPSAADSWSQDAMCMTSKHWKECYSSSVCHPRKKDHEAVTAAHGKRLRIDCKATVSIGEVSRGGLTRGDNQAWDHDPGLPEQYMPCGLVDEASGQWTIPFGRSYKTSDCIVDALDAWSAAVDEAEQVAMARL